MAVLIISPPPRIAPIADKGHDLINRQWFNWFEQVYQKVQGSGAPVLSFNTRTGDVVLTSGDITQALGFVPAPIYNPAFTGIPTAPTAPLGTNTTQIATTDFVLNEIATIPSATLLQGHATGNSTDEIFFLNKKTVNYSYTIGSDTNASSVGPITIGSTATVTVQPGGIWLVLGS